MPTVTTFDALLSEFTWNGLFVAGRPTFLTFSFLEAPAEIYRSDYSEAFLASFQPFSDADREIARQALQAWADISGLTLFEVPGDQGDIRFGYYSFSLGPDDTKDAAGFAYHPLVFDYSDGAYEDEFGGDIFVDHGYLSLELLLHEIGHALGLKHPFEGEVILDPAIDDLAHTVMTYNNVGGPATGLGSLDVVAAQFLYGAQSADGTQATSWTWDQAALLLTQVGSPEDDALAGVAVADRISAGAGDDYVMSRAGADLLRGEDGSDTMAGGEGADTLDGGAGHDALDGDGGNDSIAGGSGDDELWGLMGSDTLDGGAGDDYVAGGFGVNRLSGGGGSDTLTTFDGASTIDGGDGYDEAWLFGPEFTPTFLSYASLTNAGGSYANIESIAIWGGEAADTVAGGALPDFLFGDGGADSITGGGAADELYGEAGADTVLGGAGSDSVSGGEGANYLRGDEGDDSLSGGSDFDDINGNMGDDTGSGGLGDDWVVGGKDRDLLFGEDGADLVYGNLGSDTCEGGAGDDIVRGGQQDDVVRGGDGDDYVSGDRDNDTVSGGAGADIFHSFGQAGIDRVTDFNRTEGDRVLLDPGTVYSLAQEGSDTVVSMDGGGRMILVGVTLSSLGDGWITVG